MRLRTAQHSMDAGTFVDGRAQNTLGEEAMVVRWLDPKGTAVHSALFMGRCVAKDGDTINGKVIVRVLPNFLAVSDHHALTAWEGEYWNSADEAGGHGTPHLGVFSENQFVTELDPIKASEPGNANTADPDFRWNQEQETIAVRPGIAPPPPPAVHHSYQTAPAPSAQPVPSQVPQAKAKPCTPQGQPVPKVNVKVPPKASAWACQHMGICPDTKPVVLNGDTGCPAGQPAK